MYGEHLPEESPRLPSQGSSPHVRGARRGVLARGQPTGVIPACTGSTSLRMGVLPGTRGHPRMYGEHRAVKDRERLHRGSSPHVRGALGEPADRVLQVGVIPACTGSTRPPPPRRTRSRGHPRMYGEHSYQERVRRWTAGSSPHVRGALTVPATCRRSDRGHPRMYGEHQCGLPDAVLNAGVIPACTGSTSLGSIHSVTPRGSSPHVRGAHPKTGMPSVSFGVIPACTGSTKVPRVSRLQ